MMLRIILILAILFIPSLLFADGNGQPQQVNLENTPVGQAALQMVQQKNIPKDFISQTRAVIDLTYQNKAINSYEYLDLIIKLEQLRSQNSPKTNFDWVVNK